MTTVRKKKFEYKFYLREAFRELNFICSLVGPSLRDVGVVVVVVVVVAGQLGRHSVPGLTGLPLTTAVTSRAVCSLR